MKRIALVGTSTLLGDELKDELGRRRDLWSDLRLLTFEPDSLGKVADLDGAATFVHSLSAESLEGVDLVVLPGEKAAGHDLIGELPGTATLLVVAPDYPVDDGVVLVEGVNLADGRLPEAALGRRILVSPHPAAVALSLLLHPLRELSLERADGLLMLPSSIRGQEGLDELLEQSRRILNFQPDPPREIFGHQLAFNLLPTPERSENLLDDVAALLGKTPAVSLHQVQASVFHGCTLAVHLSFAGEPSLDSIRERLAGGSFVSLPDAPGLGPIDSAGRDDIQVLHLGADGSGGNSSFWLVAVFDNLTRGGAKNAVAIVDALSHARN